MTPSPSPLAHRSLLLAGVFALTTGCVVYDDTCTDDGFWSDDSGWGDGYGDGDGDHAQDVEFWMNPDTVAQGQTVIAGLQADVAVDWTQVADIEVFGDITLCTTQARADELLLTLAVDDDALLGGVDMLLRMQDGEVFFLEEIVFVVEGPGSGDGSADGSGSDGSGTDGSGTDGSGTDGSGSSGSGTDGSGACG